ncbi:MAG: substrate-binding domain-containing protein [Muricoprocola sp.]
MKRKQKIEVCLLIFIAIVLFTGCKRQTQDGEKQLKFAYICKDLDHYWFQQVSLGIEQKCMEKGIEYQAFDSDYDNNLCLEQVKQIAEENYDGLLICVTDQYLGGKIGDICKKAEIPIITIDDSMKDSEGKTFPFVGMALREVGSIGGVALAAMAKEKDFPAERTHIVEVDVPGLTTFRERLTGYEEALYMNYSLDETAVLELESNTGMYQENYEACREYFSENPPDTEDYWIICGANDDCALAPMKVLENMGVEREHIIACGLGGYELSIQEFENNNENYITVMTQPDVEGAKATEMLYEYITEEKPVSTSYVLGGMVATCDNYMIYFKQ